MGWLRSNLNHTIMRKNYYEKFPVWVDDVDTNYDLCLTDDIDSLLSCAMLSKIKGYKINLFYDFDGLYSLQDSPNKAIGVDMDITNGKAWGNHVIKVSSHDAYNKEVANLNVVADVSRKNYTSKFCGSTLLTIMSYYNISVENLSEEGKMILLAVDGTYSPFYNDRFKGTAKGWLVNVLEYQELYEVIERHTKQEFTKVIEKYGLYKSINVVDGHLETEIDIEGISKALNGLEIELPDGGLTKEVSFKNVYHDLSDDSKFHLTKNHIDKDIFSLAVTFKHSISYSVPVS